jgi:cation transport ATPase
MSWTEVFNALSFSYILVAMSVVLVYFQVRYSRRGFWGRQLRRLASTVRVLTIIAMLAAWWFLVTAAWGTMGTYQYAVSVMALTLGYFGGFLTLVGYAVRKARRAEAAVAKAAYPDGQPERGRG